MYGALGIKYLEFPIVDLKDFVIIFDSEVLPKKTLQLVYYQVLNL